MTKELIILLFSTISTIIIAYVKIYFDNKANTKKIAAKEDEGIKRLEAMERTRREAFEGYGLQIARLTEMLTKHIEDSEFRLTFYNTLSERASILLNNNLALDEYPEFTDIMLEWAKYLQDFGIKFFYSNYRKSTNKNDLRKFLELDMTSALSQFETRLKLHIGTEKAYQVNGRMKCIMFHDYLRTTNFYKKGELLVERLVENGIQEKKLIDIFSDYLEKFIIEFMKAINGFRGLNDYENELKKNVL